MFYLDWNKFIFIMTDRTPYWECWSSGKLWAIKVSRLGAKLQENGNKKDKFVQYCNICLQHQFVSRISFRMYGITNRAFRLQEMDSTAGATLREGRAGKA